MVTGMEQVSKIVAFSRVAMQSSFPTIRNHPTITLWVLFNSLLSIFLTMLKLSWLVQLTPKLLAKGRERSPSVGWKRVTSQASSFSFLYFCKTLWEHQQSFRKVAIVGPRTLHMPSPRKKILFLFRQIWKIAKFDAPFAKFCRRGKSLSRYLKFHNE